MAKVPKFNKGRIGNLTASDLNTIGKTVNDSRSYEETAPAKTGGRNQFQFPIFAILGSPVSSAPPPEPLRGEDKQDDEEEKPGEESKPISFNGYEWAEVLYDGSTGQWTNQDPRRQYDGDNPAFALVNYPEEYEKNYFGQKVMLFPSLDKYARPILVFERPAPITGIAAIGKITSQPHLACRSEPGGYYDIDVFQISDGSTTGENGLVLESYSQFPGQNIQPALAVNLAEQSGFGLGGQVTSSDCDIESQLTPIPIGTFVQIKFLSFVERPFGEFGQARPVYGFNLSNDLCVQCCTQPGLRLPEGFKQGTFARDPTQSPRRTSVISSINAEMMR